MYSVTIFTLPTNTLQQVFDFVANHLLTQGKKAINITGGCVYNHAGASTACAIGCLIPEEMYDNSIEGGNIEEVLETYDVPNISQEMYKLLAALQNVHDGYLASRWEIELIAVAETFDLKHKLGNHEATDS